MWQQREPKGPPGTSSAGIKTQASPGKRAAEAWPGPQRDGLGGDPLYLLAFWFRDWLWAGQAVKNDLSVRAEASTGQRLPALGLVKDPSQVRRALGEAGTARCPPRARLVCPPAPPPGAPVSAAQMRAWGPGTHHMAGTPSQASPPAASEDSWGRSHSLEMMAGPHVTEDLGNQMGVRRPVFSAHS